VTPFLVWCHSYVLLYLQIDPSLLCANSSASDGDENHGVYTSALLQHLDTPGITIEEFFKKVRLTVLKKSTGHQTPWESTSLTGKFVFKSE